MTQPVLLKDRQLAVWAGPKILGNWTFRPEELRSSFWLGSQISQRQVPGVQLISPPDERVVETGMNRPVG